MFHIMAQLDTAVFVIDIQRYYTEASSPLVSYTERLYPGGTQYLHHRLDALVIPNIARLLASARASGLPIIYARLCGTKNDRSDLHRNFQDFDCQAFSQAGIHVYPLAHEAFAEIDLRITPQSGDIVIDKTGYSAFHSTNLHPMLEKMGIRELVMTGLTTSQCVNSTARAASDYGYITHMVEDAQADYDASDHRAALYASEAITGHVVSTEEMLRLLT